MVEATYNYLVAEYSPKPATKYTTHKTSELRSIYSNIIKLANCSPLYMVKLSAINQMYAINLKDASLSLNTVAHSLLDETTDNLFFSKQAITNNSAVSATLPSNSVSDPPNPFSINVLHLAKGQINTSKMMSSNSCSIKEGDYNFNIKVDEDTFAFAFHVNKKSTNKDLMQKLASFINKSNIKVDASLKFNKDSSSLQMILSSTETGVVDDITFSLFDTDANSNRGIVNSFDLNHVTSLPENAVFELNGEQKEALSNNFTVGNLVEITLHDITNEDVLIDYEPDSNKIMSALTKLTDHYNDVISVANNYTETQKRAKILLFDLSNIVSLYNNELESCGVSKTNDGSLIIDESIAMQAAMDGSITHLLREPNGFTSSIIRKTNLLTINPMDYVDKTIINYPNYRNLPFPNPYITSVYSGMLFNSYC